MNMINNVSFSKYFKAKLKYLPSIMAGILIHSPAQALTINLIDIGTTPMTAQQMTAFNEAAQIWENKFSDPITLTLNVAWDSASEFSNPNVLAATTTARATFNASTVRACLLADSSGATETGADTLLPTPDVPLVDINGSRDDNKVTMAFANGKALGVTPALDPVYGQGLVNNADGQVRYNMGFLTGFDIDRNNGIASGQYDFIGVAAHEIGHALGFFSVTDVQDGNPSFTLYPNTLDLWRFNEIDGNHNVTTGDRIITAGDAEYFDGILNNVPFSRGVMVTDSLCGNSSGECQASHWQDGLGNLMDPTVSTGVLVNPTSDDIHALDYIGYDSKLAYILPWFEWEDLRLWFFDPICYKCPIELSQKFFRQFPQPPKLANISAPFDGENVAFVVGLSGKERGFESRSGIGFAKFEQAQKNKNPSVMKSTVLDKEGQWEMEEFSLLPLEVIPARLTNFYFETDSVEGVPFRFTGIFSEDGTSFDPTLGKYGGFRISGVIDTSQDDSEGDIDATSTFVLLLQEEVDVNRKGGIKNQPFSIKWQDGSVIEDNVTTIIDYEAFKLPKPDADRGK